MDAIRHRVMGTRESRTGDLIAFERHKRAKALRTGERCYSLALTVEAQRLTGAPVASVKMSNDMVMDEHQHIRKELISVS